MTNRDVAAAEAAELSLLRDQAAKRQQELAATVEALSGRLHDRESLRKWTRQTAVRAAAATWNAARREAARRWRDPRVRRAVLVTVAVPAAAAATVAATLTWRHVRGGSAARQRPGHPG